MNSSSNNPLLNTPQRLGNPCFDRIQVEHFPSAFEASLAEARGNLERLKNSSEEPSFLNTIEALETATETLDAVHAVFMHFLHGHTNEELQRISGEILPRLAEFSNDISLDEKIFARVKAVWELRAQIGKNIDKEQLRLLEKFYLYFTRNGANLDDAGKKRLREIDARVSVLRQKFGDHVMKAMNAFELHLTAPEDLAGLPDFVRQDAAEEAKSRGKSGWVFTLQAPSYIPFMQYSERRDLREILWKVNMTRTISGDTDNRGVLLEITRLKHERARLLGYASHAHFTLEERMAADPEKAREFLQRILKGALPAAKRDIADLVALSKLSDFRPWDIDFWSEKLRKQRFGFDEETLIPYFKLENVVEGVFEHARRLYGLKFAPRPDLPVYHPDVMTYEVQHEKSGEHVGLLYADFFLRSSKQDGAWTSSLRDQGLWSGSVERPVVAVICNFSEASGNRPSLLTLEEVKTVFHEFGHALHCLLSRVHYRAFAGTHVGWDFVELPSQIMENWVIEEESLGLFARHYLTGEKIPSTLVKQVRDAARFQAGYEALQQLSLGFLDLAWHSADTSSVTDVESFERAVLDPLALFPHVPGTMISPGFSHIFAGGYSAGYYSYKWAEVLDADAFELFREKGLFDHDVAERFRKFILERGGTEHPMELYKKFRGREPDPDALLRRDGLASAQESP